MRRERRGIVLPYCHSAPGATGVCTGPGAKQGAQVRCYHHIEMRPETVGRVLGIGLRVAGRVAGQRIGSSVGPLGTSSDPRPSTDIPRQGSVSAAGNRVNRSAGGRVVRGLGGFLRPFSRVGGILWLEVTGVFFFLPVLVFAPTLWRTRGGFAHGPDHRTFIASAVVVAVFSYLGVTSFWRARRRSLAGSTGTSK
jgi:hypothetical protein